MRRRALARRRRPPAPRRREGIGVLCLLTALVLAISFLPQAGGVAIALERWQRLALGRAAPALPTALLAVGLVLAVARGRFRITRRLAGLALAAATLLAAAHARTPAGLEFAVARRGEGTGAAGAVLVWGARRLLGEPGLWLLLAVGGAGALLLLTGLSVRRLAELLLALVAPIPGLILRGAAALRQGAGGLARLMAEGAERGWRRAAPAVAVWASTAGGRARVRAAAVVATAAARLRAHRPAGTPVPVLEGGPSAASLGGAAGAPARGEGAVAPEHAVPPRAAGAPETAAATPGVPEGADSPPRSAPAATAGADRSSPDEPLPPAVRRRRQRREEGHQESLLPDAPEAYQLPPLSLLADLPQARRGRWDPAETARHLEQTLASFGVEARVVHWEQGPVVTRFEVQPAPGVKVQRIASLTNDIALHLAAPSVRIEAPIPGKSAVGIELPNQKASLVHLREILALPEFQTHPGALVIALGKDIAGHPIVADLTEMPHLLIAGATGSGKSVMLNAIIASLLFRYTPRQVRLVMIDPKRVEMTHYNEIPHLLVPVVTNPRAAAGALKEMLRVMEQRFERFARAGVRNIQAYNALTDVEPLPFIVIVIDELADLMMVAPADFEDVIVRLAQMTRATGIHLVVATQRPSVDVITGLIKANIPSRIAFAVSSQVDSRTIIDTPGAEKLLGRGDMLFLPIGASRPVRAQGSFITDGEIQAVVDWWRGQGRPQFDESLLQAGQQMAAGEGGEDHARLSEAARIVVRAGYGSVSLLQRKMRIGYVTAARLIDQLEERGIVGPAQGSNPREVLVGVEALERLLRARPEDDAAGRP